MTTYYATISGGSGSGYYQPLQSFGISASPPQGKHFTFWSSGGGLSLVNANADSTNASLLSNGWATANFEWIMYTIRFAAGAGGSLTGGEFSQQVQYGDYAVGVTAVPNSGYVFSHWETTGVTNPTLYRGVAATESRTYTAVFVAATPVVSSLDVVEGGVGGGTAITITGSNFTGTTSVKFGGNSATGVSVVSDTTITCTTPAHAVGAVDVTVTNANGTGTKTNGYTYIIDNRSQGGEFGSSTMAGALSYTYSHSQSKSGEFAAGSIAGRLSWGSSGPLSQFMGEFDSSTMRGDLYIYLMRPKTLKAPWVQVTLNCPTDENQR